MSNEFIVKNGLIVGGNVVTSGTITINGALAATQSWVTSQAYLTSASLSGYATQSYVTSAISALIDAAPGALDTLNELAAALGDDANFSTTITNSIASKQSQLNGTGLVRMSGTSVSYDNTTYLISNFGNIEGDHTYGYPSSNGWYKIAEIVLTSSCQSFNLWGEYRDTGYFDNSHYRIHITARAECDFPTNNESHAINVNIYGSSTNETYFSNNVRVVLTSSSSNYRKYELQYYRETWDTGSWNLQTLGWTTYTTSQTAGTPTGTPRVYYVSKFSTDNIFVANRLSIGTTYAGFAANIAGTTYIIGASAWVNDGYGLTNASSPGTGFFPYSDGTLVFNSANSEKMRVASSGNVGINTNSPNEKLTVVGNINVLNSGGTKIGFGTSDSFIAYGSSTAHYGISWGWTSNPLVLSGYFGVGIFSEGAERMRITGSGNVGIGTTSPVANLSVVGTVNLGAQTSGFYNTNSVLHIAKSGVAQITFEDYQVTAGIAVAASVMSFGNQVSDATYRFKYNNVYNGNFASTGTTLVQFNPTTSYISAGNFGIGTTSPDTPLVVQGGSAGTGGWNRTATLSATYPGLIFNSNGTKWGGMAYDYSSAMRFWVNASNNDIFAGTLAMSILNNGNIGIGTSNPSTKLDVIGNAWINRPSNKVDNASCTELPSRVEFNNAFASGQSGYMIFRYPTYNNFLISGDYDGNVGGAIPNIQFGRQSTVYMHINSSNGNIGIGTIAPDSPLEVDGRVSIRGGNELYFGQSTSGIGSWTTRMYASGSTHKFNASTFIFNNEGYGGSEYMRITSAGNIGINTTTPYAGTGVTSVTINAAGYPTLAFQNNGSRTGELIGYYNHLALNTPGFIALSPGDSEAVRITTSGNVGIGSTSPTQKLHIVGTGASNDGITIQNTNASGNSQLRFLNTSGTERAAITYVNGADAVYHYTAGGGNLLNLVGANVGIGTNGPSDKLSVNGNIGVEYAGYFGFYRYSSAIHTFSTDGITSAMFGIAGGVFSGRSDAGLTVSGYDQLRFYTENSERIRINRAGKVSIGTTDTNSDKSDFTVYTGSGASLALTDDQVRMGGADVNWGVALRSYGALQTYGQALALNTQAGNYAVNVQPNGTTVAQFYQDYSYFPGLDFSISRVNGTHSSNYFRGDASHLVIGTGGTLHLNYGNTSGNTYISGSTYVNSNLVWHQGNLTNLNQLTNGPGYIASGSTISDTGSWTNATKFKSSGDISYVGAGNHSLQIFSDTNNDAFIAFHISGDYAVYFGLDDSSNRLHTGGWSEGANKYQIWDTRDFTSTNISNWSTAYSWGNHASAGYLTSGSLSGYATTSYVTTQINNLIAGAPGALDTLDELAAALGDDSNFATTVTNSIAGKVSKAGDIITTSNNYGLVIDHTPALGDFVDALLVRSTTSGQRAQIGFATVDSDGNHHRASIRAYKGPGTLEGVFGIALRQAGSGAHIQRLTLDYLGNLTIGGALTESSSIKLKENVETSEGNLEKVVNLRPVTYNKIGSQTTELGLIAEEVAEVYPEFVQYDENGEPIGVNYSRLTAALIGAVKELTNQVQELNKKING